MNRPEELDMPHTDMDRVPSPEQLVAWVEEIFDDLERLHGEEPASGHGTPEEPASMSTTGDFTDLRFTSSTPQTTHSDPF